MNHTGHDEANVLEMVFSLESEEDLGILDFFMESAFHHHFGWEDTCLEDFKGFDETIFFDSGSIKKDARFFIRFEGQYINDFFSENPKQIPARLSVEEIPRSA